jgi:sigma-B regulation protein RsbU (phosphoserine phosphatase)
MTDVQTPHQRRNVLVVTDTPEDMEALQSQLGEEGYELDQAWAADEALRRTREMRPALVLLDINMSEADGVEFCKQLHSRAETEAVPVIVIAEETDGQQERVLDIGADGVICRPFQAAELLTRVRTLVRMKDLHDRVAEQNRQLLDVNARLDQVNQEMMQRNRELEQGMAMARRLQEALLPQQYPHVKNISFSHKYTSADAIGGDFFQIEGMEDGRAAIFIADVSGHGVRAAIVASIVKTVIDYIDLNDKTPTEALQDFNSRFRSVLGPMTPQIYATGILMMVDGENRSVSLACAGHPSPLHVSKARATAEPLVGLDACGPAIGFLPDPEYPTVERKLEVSDIVLGFTDGIYEVINEQSEMLGLSRLQELVAANTRLIPRDLIQRIITETEEYMGTARHRDDICIVTVEVH